MMSLAKPARAEQRIEGQVASSGFAAGRIVHLAQGSASVPQASRGADEELAQFCGALTTAGAELADLIQKLDDDEAIALVEFQIAMLEDDSVTDPVNASIRRGCGAVTAWTNVLNAMVADYQAAEDEYFRGRGSDLVDLRDRVIRCITGDVAARIPAGCILLTDDLLLTQFLETDWTGSGIALTAGSATSHVAMLARARSVPMLVSIQSPREHLAGEALLDGDSGVLTVTPSSASLMAFRKSQTTATERAKEEGVYLDRPAVTATGERISVYLNIAGPDDLDRLDARHCDGIGLVRTELLFSGADGLADEEAQFLSYRHIVEWAAGRPVTIRTLDAGGDKPIPGVTIDGETNPFLGVRGFRLSLRNKGVFKTQLRAMLRASAFGSIKIMLPMITVPEEMTAARQLMDEAKAELSTHGEPMGSCALGMMVEVPAAAIAIEDFDADFYSIGSNDLVQYVMAAGRDNSHLAGLSRGDATAVQFLMARVARHGRAANREVSICGDIAGDSRYVHMLLDCGLRALSVAPSALARTKAAVGRYKSNHG